MEKDESIMNIALSKYQWSMVLACMQDAFNEEFHSKKNIDHLKGLVEDLERIIKGLQNQGVC